MSHYDDQPVKYTAIFHCCKNVSFSMKNTIFLIFARNIDYGYTLEPPHNEAVLTSTHNLGFRVKIRKMYTPVNLNFTI